MARKLRIAASIFFGMLTMTLCVMWVRSFWTLDQWFLMYRAFVMLQSNYGHLSWQCSYENSITLHGPGGALTYAPGPADGRPPFLFWRFDDTGHVVAAPHLLLAVLPATIACLPWIRWKFSLRAMLIGTTLVAMAIGLVVRFRG